jgi:exonuclease SbcD
MRVIHTSDWHLGRSFHGASLASEQEAVLQRIVGVVRDERVDVVLVAGDLYDRQLPPLDAVRLLSEALQELRASGATVVAIAGNHDSHRRLGFAQGLLATAGVHLRGDVRGADRPVVVPATDGGADLAVYPVPYLEPEVARHHLGVPGTRSHDGLLRLALGRARGDLAARGPVRSIAMAHAFVAGGTPCDSERALSVGGSDRVPLRCLEGFDYVALGHLHGRQTMAGGRVRYAGSPLAYSFSERDHTKGMWLVDLPADGGTPRVEAVDLAVGRPLAVLRGGLDALLTDPRHAAAEGSWVAATLTDAVLPREAMARLRRRFPHAAALTHEPPRAAGDGAPSYAERVRGRDDLALVDGFLRHVAGRPLDPAERDDCTAALDHVLRAEAA